MRLPGGYTISLPRAVLGGLILAVLLGGIAAGATSTTAFGAYNGGWDGSHAYRSLAAQQTTPIVGTTSHVYRTVTPNQTTAIILAPETPYRRRSLSDVQSFVQQGGTLIVASDFGTSGNDLLRGLGLQTRFNGSLLRDEEHYYRSPALPIATHVKQRPLTGNASQLTLNYATVLDQTGNATVLATTSNVAYLDRNRNGQLDQNESLQSYPVAAVARSGQGRVIMVSDPSIFINRMLKRNGNRAFAQGILGTSQTVVFDYSHATAIPPLQALALTLRTTPLAAFALLGILLFAIGIWASGQLDPLITTLRQRLAEEPSDRTSGVRINVEAIIRERYPDWPQDRVQRVATRIRTNDESNPP